jgi:hypothetical protein
MAFSDLAIFSWTFVAVFCFVLGGKKNFHKLAMATCESQ